MIEIKAKIALFFSTDGVHVTRFAYIYNGHHVIFLYKNSTRGGRQPSGILLKIEDDLLT
jgi:hypothetical protein